MIGNGDADWFYSKDDIEMSASKKKNHYWGNPSKSKSKSKAKATPIKEKRESQEEDSACENLGNSD